MQLVLLRPTFLRAGGVQVLVPDAQSIFHVAWLGVPPCKERKLLSRGAMRLFLLRLCFCALAHCWAAFSNACDAIASLSSLWLRRDGTSNPARC